MPAKAKAPSPDRIELAHKRAERAAQPNAKLKLRWKGKLHVLDQQDLGPGDDMICRAQTGAFTGEEGYAITGLMNRMARGDVTRIGTDILAVVLWMARRKTGEPNLGFAEVIAEIGSTADFMANLTMDMEVQEPDPAGESSGPDESLPGSGPDSPSDSASTRATA